MCVWCVFLGSASAWARGAHIVINVLPHRLKGVSRKALLVFGQSLSAVFLICVWLGGIQIMVEQHEAKTTALEISISWFYLGLFLGACGMLLFHLQQIVATLRRPAGMDETGP
jgi:TRAP-type C4-dicarboxylate transport system permease small subunit